MKSFWNKLLFRDAPAQGAFFALTLWITGFYLLSSVFFYFWCKGVLNYYFYGVNTLRWEPVRMLIPVLVFLLVPIYYFCLTRRFFQVRKLGWKCFAVFAGPPALVLLLPLVNLLICLFPAWQNDLAERIFFTLLLFPLCFCGKGRIWAAGAFAAWGGGLFLLLAALDGVTFANPGIVAWRVWIGVALLLLAGGYLLSAKLLAVYSEVRFRSLFGRSVWVLWAIVAAIYLAFTFLAISVERETAWRLDAVRERSGPLTPEALGRLYFRDSPPDSDFWTRITELHRKDRTTLPKNPSDRYELSSAESARLRQELKRNEAAFAELEKAFSGPIPPPPRVFQFKGMLDLRYINFYPMNRFGYIELWRLRFALEDGDFIGALAAYERLGNLNQALSREIFMLGTQVWVRGEMRRLDALEMLLESGLLTNDELRRTSDALLQTETETLPRMLERMRYSEVVDLLDVLPLKDEDEWNESWFEGANRGIHRPSRKALSPFLPQFRWWLALDKAELYGKIIDFPGKEDEFCWDELRPYYSWWICEIDGTRETVCNLVARLRAERVLIAAELYKREHGDYPETMADLPLDPFTGKPLRYRKGDSLWQVPASHEEDAAEDSSPFSRAVGETTKNTVHGVQVWGSGRDRHDNDGGNDDVRAILRMQGGK